MITPREVQEAAENMLGVQLVPRAEKHLTPRGYTSVCQVLGDIDYVWVYSIGEEVAVHRSHDKAEIESFYAWITGEDGEVNRFQKEMRIADRAKLANWIRDNPPAPATEAEALKAEVERLRKQNQQLRAKLKKLQAKTKHHLSERDRYRDLYAKADKALREESARHPNF